MTLVMHTEGARRGSSVTLMYNPIITGKTLLGITG